MFTCTACCTDMCACTVTCTGARIHVWLYARLYARDQHVHGYIVCTEICTDIWSLYNDTGSSVPTKVLRLRQFGGVFITESWIWALPCTGIPLGNASATKIHTHHIVLSLHHCKASSFSCFLRACSKLLMCYLDSAGALLGQ